MNEHAILAPPFTGPEGAGVVAIATRPAEAKRLASSWRRQGARVRVFQRQIRAARCSVLVWVVVEMPKE